MSAGAGEPKASGLDARSVPIVRFELYIREAAGNRAISEACKRELLVENRVCQITAELKHMAEEQPSLHIDSDWKRQAQEEKKRLAEQEAQRAKPAAPAAGPAAAAAPGARTAGAAPAGATGRTREMPPASFPTLVQSILTQVLFYLGDLTPRGAEPQLNLDMAKHNVDTLTMLEEKTKGNLTEEEQRLLDAALYEARMRYVNVASQFTS